MNYSQSARRYARAIIETATDNRAVRDELLAIDATLKANPALLEALSNPAVPSTNKKAIFAAVFEAPTAPIPKLFEMLIDGARVELIHEIVKRYRDRGRGSRPLSYCLRSYHQRGAPCRGHPLSGKSDPEQQPQPGSSG